MSKECDECGDPEATFQINEDELLCEDCFDAMYENGVQHPLRRQR